MIDHEKLKVRLQADPPLQSAPAEDAPGHVEPVTVKTQCPVCHWGLRVTVEPVGVVD